MIRVKDIMAEHLTPLHEQMSLAQAIDHLMQSKMLGLPVINHQKQLVGFLSEHDCIPYLIGDSYHCDSHVLVKDMMRTQPLTITADTSIFEMAQMMATNKPKIYPVLDGGKLVGVVDRSAVMATLNKQLKGCRVA